MTNLIDSINSVNSINKTNTVNKEDVKKLVQYVNGELLQDKPDTFVSTVKSGATFAGIFEGIPLLKFLKRRALLKKNADKIANGGFVENAMSQLKNTKKNALNNLFHGSEKLTTRIKDYVKTANDSVDAYRNVRSVASAQSKQIKALKKGGDSFIKASKRAEDAIQTANETIGNIGKTVEKKPGIIKQFISNKFSKLTVKNPKLAETLSKIAAKPGNLASAFASKFPKLASKLGKFGKAFKSSGAGLWIVFSGLGEAKSEVIPTFKQLGTEKGIKQAGKSAIKVAGDAAGYILGAKAGAAIGTAICPGAGSAVGAIFGLVGGMLGSFITGKITKKITGKTELQKAKEAEEQKQIEEISKDKEALKELKEIAAQKINEEYQTTGTLSQESQMALESFNKLENPFAA